jgi:hypothetical protein
MKIRRTIFVAAAVILALAGSAFAATSPYMKSRYYQLSQRERILSTQTIQTHEGQLEWLNWAAILKARHTVDICDNTTLELTSHTLTHHADYSELGADKNDTHAGLPLKVDEYRRYGGWWEPYEIQLGKSERHDRIDLWGRTALDPNAYRDEVHVV